jgi:hypothetical protein
MAVAPAAAEQFQFPDEKEEKAGVPGAEEQALEISVEGETDVQIDVIDDTPPEDRGRKVGVSKNITEVSDEELAKHSEDVQKRLKELSFARHDERRGKEAALRERAELEQVAQRVLAENKQLREYVKVGEQAYQGTAKTAAQARLDIAKSKYKAAHEAFDADALIEAQQEMTTAQMELQAAENFKPRALQAPEEGVERQPTQPIQIDEQVARWKQQNQWFGVNKRMTAYALAAHQDLVEAGVDPRSDEYYKRLDADLRGTFPKNFGETEGSPVATAQPHRKPANVVAPAARSGNVKKISITQTGANLAKKLGISVEEYAKHVALLETQNAR